MKINKFIYCFLSIVVLTLSSCTNEDYNDRSKLLKKIVETSDRGVVTTTTFLYNGSEIVSIEDNKSLQEFKYTLDYITAIETTNKATSAKKRVDYFYDNEKLIQVKSVGDYLINYVHQKDGTVLYEKFNISKLNVETKLYHGILTFTNGNIIKEERIYDTVESGTVSKYEVNYEYDFKSNPLHNIVGYDKLLDQDEAVSTNNYLIITEETSIEKDDQIISSASFYKNTYKYDNGNYPTEKKSSVSIPQNGIAVNLNAIYNY